MLEFYLIYVSSPYKLGPNLMPSHHSLHQIFRGFGFCPCHKTIATLKKVIPHAFFDVAALISIPSKALVCAAAIVCSGKGWISGLFRTDGLNTSSGYLYRKYPVITRALSYRGTLQLQHCTVF